MPVSPLVGAYLAKRFRRKWKSRRQLERLNIQWIPRVLTWLEQAESAELLKVVHLNRDEPSDRSSSLCDLEDGAVLDAIKHAGREVAQLAHGHLIHGYDRSTRLSEVQSHAPSLRFERGHSAAVCTVNAGADSAWAVVPQISAALADRP